MCYVMNQVFSSGKRHIHRLIARLVATVLRGGAVYDPVNFRIWESRGYHITPVNFYSPIPDTREIKERPLQYLVLPGIDLRPEFQRRLLREIFPEYSGEYNMLPINHSNGRGFYLDNDAFGGIDPHVYYCMIRHLQPSTIIEIGSGYSTLLGAQTSKKNTNTKLITVDPWPPDFVASGLDNVELLYRRVEELDTGFFHQLQQNDILFVDSSHVVRTAGDVCFLILDVLPRLREGVIVHFHDIFIPYDYPREWLVEKHIFWTEQYLLQAYLADNPKVEVLFASNFMAHEHPHDLKITFPNALWWGGGSFWIRKSG